MMRLNKTETPIFVLLCVLCSRRQPFSFFVIAYYDAKLCENISEETQEMS